MDQLGRADPNWMPNSLLRFGHRSHDPADHMRLPKIALLRWEPFTYSSETDPSVFERSGQTLEHGEKN